MTIIPPNGQVAPSQRLLQWRFAYIDVDFHNRIMRLQAIMGPLSIIMQLTIDDMEQFCQDGLEQVRRARTDLARAQGIPDEKIGE
jgi:hypothetical protein